MNNIKNAITSIKGQFVSLKWHKTCSTYKNVTENIEKETITKEESEELEELLSEFR